MIAQWENEFISLLVLSMARVQFSGRGEMAQSPLNDTTQPVDSEEEGRGPTMAREWLE